MNDDKLHPLRTGDGKWHSAASHDNDPMEFRRRMEEYRRRVKEEPVVRVVDEWRDGIGAGCTVEVVIPIAKRKAAP